MSNAKSIYSDISQYYCEIKTKQNEADKVRYENAKIQERKHNEKWKKEKVNLIEIVNKYAPNAKAYEKGVKFYFEGIENIVMADMVAGYVRIRKKGTKLYYRLDGSLTESKEGTHFKIKRKEEM